MTKNRPLKIAYIQRSLIGEGVSHPANLYVVAPEWVFLQRRYASSIQHLIFEIIMTNQKKLLCAAFASLFALPAPAADSNQMKAWKEINDFAEVFCIKFEPTSEEKTNKLSAEAQASIDGVLKRLTNLGLTIGGSYHTKETRGPLQEHYAGLLKNRQDCKFLIWQDLRKNILENQPASNKTKVKNPKIPKKNKTPLEGRLCYYTETLGWSSPYSKTAKTTVRQIKCGKKDVKDPATCGFHASIGINLANKGGTSDAPLIGQERYLRTLSNTCSPQSCCGYDMDNKENTNFNGDYLYSWRHRSCATERTIVIEVSRWEATGKFAESCKDVKMNTAGYVQFDIPVMANNIELYPLKPYALPPIILDNQTKIMNGAYDYSCSILGDSKKCTIKVNK